MEIQTLFGEDGMYICTNCNEQFYDNKYSIYFCSAKCEFMHMVKNQIKEIEKLLEKELICKKCKKPYKIHLRKKTFHPFCSQKCNNQAEIKDTKTRLKKDLILLSKIHNGKISSNQITHPLEVRILNFYKTVKEAMADNKIEFVTIRKGFRASGRLSKAYKRADINNLFARSSWEANIIRVLNYFGWVFQYEPQFFKFPVKKGNRYYLPDLYLPAWDEYIEIKGYMDKSSKTKITRFKKYYPENKLSIIGKEEYNIIENMGLLLPVWEWNKVSDVEKDKVFKKYFL